MKTWSTYALIVALLIGAAGQARLQACPVCFGIEDGPTASGVRAAVIVLMGVTTCVLAGFAWFIARFVKRGRIPSSARSRT